MLSLGWNCQENILRLSAPLPTTLSLGMMGDKSWLLPHGLHRLLRPSVLHWVSGMRLGCSTCYRGLLVPLPLAAQSTEAPCGRSLLLTPSFM